jgi:hypothetical protein
MVAAFAPVVDNVRAPNHDFHNEDVWRTLQMTKQLDDMWSSKWVLPEHREALMEDARSLKRITKPGSRGRCDRSGYPYRLENKRNNNSNCI